MKEAGFTFDVAFTSMLKVCHLRSSYLDLALTLYVLRSFQRAIKTLWMTLEQLDSMFIPITHSWRLNERHYGALQVLVVMDI